MPDRIYKTSERARMTQPQWTNDKPTAPGAWAYREDGGEVHYGQVALCDGRLRYAGVGHEHVSGGPLESLPGEWCPLTLPAPEPPREEDFVENIIINCCGRNDLPDDFLPWLRKLLTFKLKRFMERVKHGQRNA